MATHNFISCACPTITFTINEFATDCGTSNGRVELNITDGNIGGTNTPIITNLGFGNGQLLIDNDITGCPGQAVNYNIPCNGTVGCTGVNCDTNTCLCEDCTGITIGEPCSSSNSCETGTWQTDCTCGNLNICNQSPVVSCGGNITLQLGDPSHVSSASATDCDGDNLNVICSPNIVSTNSVGTTTVTCSATSVCNNTTGICSYTVTVVTPQDPCDPNPCGACQTCQASSDNTTFSCNGPLVGDSCTLSSNSCIYGETIQSDCSCGNGTTNTSCMSSLCEECDGSNCVNTCSGTCCAGNCCTGSDICCDNTCVEVCDANASNAPCCCGGSVVSFPCTGTSQLINCQCDTLTTTFRCNGTNCNPEGCDPLNSDCFTNLASCETQCNTCLGVSCPSCTECDDGICNSVTNGTDPNNDCVTGSCCNGSCMRTTCPANQTFNFTTCKCDSVADDCCTTGVGCPSCTGGEPYDCCAGTPYCPVDNIGCCAGTLYDRNTQQCCGTTVISSGQSCCGTSVYIPTSSLQCCNDSLLYNPQSQGCCNGNTYDLSTEVCCENTVCGSGEECCEGTCVPQGQCVPCTSCAPSASITESGCDVNGFIDNPNSNCSIISQSSSGSPCDGSITVTWINRNQPNCLPVTDCYVAACVSHLYPECRVTGSGNCDCCPETEMNWLCAGGCSEQPCDLNNNECYATESECMAACVN